MPITIHTTIRDVNVPVFLAGYPGAGGVGTAPLHHPLKVSLASLRRAALMVGHPRGFWSKKSRIYKNYANLRKAGISLALNYKNGTQHKSVKTVLDRLLEVAEKVPLAGIFGNAVTKLLAEKIIGAKLMFFTELYNSVTGHSGPNAKSLTFNTKKRGDFFAQIPSGLWVSIESKARTAKKLSVKDNVIAKAQANSLTWVNMQSVYNHFVSAVFIRESDIAAEFYDPPPTRDNRIAVTEFKLLENYYRSVRDLADTDFPRHSLSINGEVFEMFSLEECGFSAGLHPAVESYLQSSGESVTLDGLDKILDGLKESYDVEDAEQQKIQLHCGPDGVLIHSTDNSDTVIPV